MNLMFSSITRANLTMQRNRKQCHFHKHRTLSLHPILWILTFEFLLRIIRLIFGAGFKQFVPYSLFSFSNSLSFFFTAHDIAKRSLCIFPNFSPFIIFFVDCETC